jgi:hypothetical protein
VSLCDSASWSCTAASNALSASPSAFSASWVMQGDRQAMDRLLELNGELDRYHGFRRAQLAAAAEAAPLRLVPPPRALLEASSAADPR